MSEARASDMLRGPSAGSVFPRESRLTKPTEFKRVFNRPTVSSDRWFKVLARGDGGERARLGMAVSRQVDKRAVRRNRLKRVIRESFRQHFAGGGPAVDFVVLPRAESATICTRRLSRSLERHWALLLDKLEAGPAES